MYQTLTDNIHERVIICSPQNLISHLLEFSLRPDILMLGVGSAKTMGITEGSVSDLNNEIGSTNTFYIKFCTPSSAPANVPANLSNKTRFFLEVINDSSYYILQKVYGPTSNDAWFRIKNGSTWNAWAQM